MRAWAVPLLASLAVSGASALSLVSRDTERRLLPTGRPSPKLAINPDDLPPAPRASSGAVRLFIHRQPMTNRWAGMPVPGTAFDRMTFAVQVGTTPPVDFPSDAKLVGGALNRVEGIVRVKVAGVQVFLATVTVRTGQAALLPFHYDVRPPRSQQVTVELECTPVVTMPRPSGGFTDTWAAARTYYNERR